jgi:hypothetical protein
MATEALLFIDALSGVRISTRYLRSDPGGPGEDENDDGGEERFHQRVLSP